MKPVARIQKSKYKNRSGKIVRTIFLILFKLLQKGLFLP